MIILGGAANVICAEALIVLAAHILRETFGAYGDGLFNDEMHHLRGNSFKLAATMKAAVSFLA